LPALRETRIRHKNGGQAGESVNRRNGEAESIDRFTVQGSRFCVRGSAWVIAESFLYTKRILETISRKKSRDQIDRVSGCLTKGSTSLRV
jgi:hypothetical protein